MKRSNAQLIGGLAFLGALAVYFLVLEEQNPYLLFALLLIPVVVTEVLLILFPKKKRNPKKKAASTSSKSKSKQPDPKKKLTDRELLAADLDSLSGLDFERLCYLYFKDKGYQPQMTPASGDHGVDLVIRDPKDGLQIAVQCKRHKGNIGNTDLRLLESGKRAYGCPGTLFITTSEFTPKAREYAQAVRMELWNRYQVEKRIDAWRKEKLKKMR